MTHQYLRNGLYSPLNSYRNMAKAILMETTNTYLGPRAVAKLIRGLNISYLRIFCKMVSGMLIMLSVVCYIQAIDHLS